MRLLGEGEYEIKSLLPEKNVFIFSNDMVLVLILSKII